MLKFITIFLINKELKKQYVVNCRINVVKCLFRELKAKYLYNKTIKLKGQEYAQ